MADWNKASARTAIDVAEASELAQRAETVADAVSAATLEQLLAGSAVVLDGLRRRPRYFDGRFLTGADLTRDQAYVRQRQADLARATGTGVVTGLEVGHDPAAPGDRVTIRAGHGVTPSGGLVLLASTRDVDLIDLPTIERLDFALGLRARPRVALGRRSGLFVLALRPVEFTANPIAAYPTSIDGPRTVEDGDIIEATAVTLIPYPDSGGAGTLDDARRIVARRLFVEDAGRGLPQEALPLAMIALQNGTVRWIDAAMVRRETGADTPLQVTLGGRPRALAEAFVVQHRAHLADALAAREGNGAFAAAQLFAALPPAGQVPAAAIVPDDEGFQQLWFPPSVEVDISFAPADEIAALVEDSLTLPPLDLGGDAEALDGVGVVVLAPVSRARLQQFERGLDALTRRAASAPAQGLRRAPASLLTALVNRRAVRLAPVPPGDPRVIAADAQASAWRAAWADAVAALPDGPGGAKLLWYVRRRAVPDASRIEGAAVAVTGDDQQLARQLDARVAAAGLADRVAALYAAATPFAAARISALLGGPRLIGSDLLLHAAVRALEAVVPAAPAPEPAAPVAAVPAVRPGLAVRPLTRIATRTLLATPVDPGVLTRSVEAGAITPAAARLSLSRFSAARVQLRGDVATVEKIDEGDVLDVADDFADPSLGDGIDRLVAALGAPPLDAAAIAFLGDSGRAIDLDRVGRTLGDDALADFAPKLREVVGAANAGALADLIDGVS